MRFVCLRLHTIAASVPANNAQWFAQPPGQARHVSIFCLYPLFLSSSSIVALPFYLFAMST